MKYKMLFAACLLAGGAVIGARPAAAQTGEGARPFGRTPAVPITEEGRGYFVGPAHTRVAMDTFVPDFGSRDAISGKTWALTTLAAGKKATVIAFLSTESAVSNAYAERLGTLARQYQPRGVAFIGINANPNDSLSAIASNAQQRNLSFPVLKDWNQRIAERFQVTKTPEVFVLNQDQVLVHRGAIDDSQESGQVTSQHLQTALDAVLAGQSASSTQSGLMNQSSTETSANLQQQRQRSQVIEETTVRRQTTRTPVQATEETYVTTSETRSVRASTRRTRSVQPSSERQYNRSRSRTRRSRAVRAMG